MTVTVAVASAAADNRGSGDKQKKTKQIGNRKRGQKEGGEGGGREAGPSATAAEGKVGHAVQERGQTKVVGCGADPTPSMTSAVPARPSMLQTTTPKRRSFTRGTRGCAGLN